MIPARSKGLRTPVASHLKRASNLAETEGKWAFGIERNSDACHRICELRAPRSRSNGAAG